MNGISPQLQNQITQYQQLQQQLQTATAQRIQMESQMKELQRTVEELKKATGDVYRNVGTLLIKVDDKESLAADMEESLETMEIRVRGFKNQEDSLRQKAEALSNSINTAMGNAPAPRRDDEDDE
ncbi:prefoldin, beta subunit, archaeal [Thermoplasmatales archaeon BRNA1]|nr:prefoldin, beta subunit, archaeal [Thermoplasmatales archaeon BRNA1]